MLYSHLKISREDAVTPENTDNEHHGEALNEADDDEVMSL